MNVLQAEATKREREIKARLGRPVRQESARPVLGAKTPRVEHAKRHQGIAHGGIGLFHSMARKIGLVQAIDDRLHLLGMHFPYHESDHVLNLVYNVLCGGTCLEDIELRRKDKAFLDALGADRIPDPTTAGDFLRRFSVEAIDTLQQIIHEVRLSIWKTQPDSFFHEAVLDMDGTFVPTTGECKEGMDINYKGVWSYHPLVVTLAHTGEPLAIVNRPGNVASHEGCHATIDDLIALCQRAGFRSIRLRGDTDFSQTEHLDRWSSQGVRFVFGIDAMPNLVKIADELPAEAWRRFDRPRPPEPDKPRAKPENVKQRIVVKRGYKVLHQVGERIASFAYQPGKCQRSYRVVVICKEIEERRGGVLIEGMHDRYFFYITNDEEMSNEQIVHDANARCQQENHIQQLKHGSRALSAPVNTLEANWAYMVIASIASSMKAWMALSLPTPAGRWKERREAEKSALLRMEFKRMVNSIVQQPALIVRTGRRIIYRLLSWNPWQSTFLRLAAVWLE